MYAWGERHRRAGIFFGAILCVALNYLAARVDGPRMAIVPAVIGGLAVASAAAKYLSSRKSRPKPYGPSRSYLKALEAYQRGDIERLHKPRPFEGEDLGYTPNEMGARIGEGVDQAQSEYASELSDLDRSAAKMGAPAQASGSLFRARQRAAQGLLGRSAEVRRRNVIEDARQRREDFYNRLRAELAPWGVGAQIFNQAEGVSAPGRGAGWEAISSLLASLASSGSGGAAGAAGGAGRYGYGAAIERQGASPVWA